MHKKRRLNVARQEHSQANTLLPVKTPEVYIKFLPHHQPQYNPQLVYLQSHNAQQQLVFNRLRPHDVQYKHDCMVGFGARQ